MINSAKEGRHPQFALNALVFHLLRPTLYCKEKIGVALCKGTKIFGMILNYSFKKSTESSSATKITMHKSDLHCYRGH